LPRVGDSISIEDISISVLDMDGHRIARARVSRGSRGDEVTSTDELAESADAETAADEMQGKASNELDDERVAESGGDDNSTAAGQSDIDGDYSEPARTGDTDSNPDRKAVH